MSAEIEKINFNKNQKMMIISIVTFLCAIIVATYAWITNDLFESNNTMSITSVGLELTFRGTSQEIIADLAPGEYATKTFEVTNYGDSSTAYSLYWKIAENTFVNKNYFKYSIINADTNEELITPRYLPANVSGILHNISIPAQTTHSYILKVTYIEDPLYNQTQNADQYFYGDISVRQGNANQNVIDVSSVYIDGVNVDYIPTLSDYELDTARTYCTDGSSISIIDAELQIQNQTSMTTCAVYFTSSTPAAVDKNIYNMLAVNLNGGTLDIAKDNYYYRNELVDLGIPEREGYAFTGWQISGAGATLVKNTKVRMGTTYTYAKATWVRGYWNKTTQTCGGDGVATWDRTYKTCDAILNNYTKTDKVCGVSSYTQNFYTCTLSETRNIYKCRPYLWYKTQSQCSCSRVCTSRSRTCRRIGCTSRSRVCSCTGFSNTTLTYYGCKFGGWSSGGTSCSSSGSASCTSPHTQVQNLTSESFSFNSWSTGGTSCSDSGPTSCIKAYVGMTQVDNLTRNYTNCSWTTWAVHSTNLPEGTCEKSNLTLPCNSDNVNVWKYGCNESHWTQGSLNSSTAGITNCAEDTTCTSNTDTYTTCTNPIYQFPVTAASSSTVSTCEESTPDCNASNNSQQKITCTPLAYNFGTATPTTVSTCEENIISCNSSTNGQTHTTCEENYRYELSSTTQTEEVSACSISNFACNSTTSGQEYTTDCSIASTGYGFSPTVTQTSSCFVDDAETCNNLNDVGISYVGACDLIETQ